MRKRVLTREVSMSTAFKGKSSKTKDQALNMKKADAAGTAKTQPKKTGSGKQKGEKDKGRTLVEATPVKPKINPVPLLRKGSSSSLAAAPIPALQLEGSRAVITGSVEGDDDDDEWMLEGSPDILLLTSSSGQEDLDISDSDGPDDVGLGHDGSQVLVTDTPSKQARSR